MHRRPSPALVVALLALFVALGGPAQAARLITAKDVKRNALTGRQIRNGSLALADLSSGAQTNLRRTPNRSITATKLVAGAVGSVQIAAGAVTGDRLAANAVNGTKVVDDSLTSSDIMTSAIGTDEVADNAITSEKIAPNTLVGADISDGSIDAGEVADGGLASRDIGRFTGTFMLDFGVIDLGRCASVVTTSLTPIVADQTLVDDVIVVQPQSSFPSAGVVYSAKAASANQIEVTVCNVDGPASLVLGARILRYVSIDVN